MDWKRKEKSFMDTKQKKSYVQYAWLILPILHFGLSFWYERKILIFEEGAWDIFWSVSMDDTIGNRTQSFLLYAFGKLIAGVLIFLLWYVLYTVVKAVIKKKFPMHILGMFAFILIVLGAYYFMLWPSSFKWQDSFTLYGLALRLIPWYWHHFLTSAWFVGCLMVFPHPIILSAIPYVGFAAVMLYLYHRIEKSFKPPIWSRPLIFLVYAAPETFLLVTQVYRNCIYAIILCFYITFLVMEDVDKAEFSTPKMVMIAGLSALLSVWRTEGILVGIVGIVLCVFKIYRLKKAKKLLTLVLYGIVLVVLIIPQKIGDTKYYGKDYLIVSTIEPVKNILNSPNANISYKGAEEDLQAIAAYTPLEFIRQDGIDGVRGYFYGLGHEDFDQSLVGDEVQSRYLKGFLRLALHNPGTYIKSQMNFMFDALGIGFNFEMGSYDGEYIENDYSYTLNSVGELDYVSAKGIQKIIRSEKYMKYSSEVAIIRINYSDFINKAYITAVIRVLMLIFDLVILVAEFIKLVRKKKANITYMMFAFLFFVQFGIVTMTIPAAYSLYFYSIFYPLLVMEVIYIYNKVAGENEEWKKNHKINREH